MGDQKISIRLYCYFSYTSYRPIFLKVEPHRLFTGVGYERLIELHVEAFGCAWRRDLCLGLLSWIFRKWLRRFQPLRGPSHIKFNVSIFGGIRSSWDGLDKTFTGLISKAS
jgi:hypothetical protein